MGNAKQLGMTEDLELYGNRFSITLTAFFITYVIFEVYDHLVYIKNKGLIFFFIISPTNILCKRFGPKIWLSFICFVFGFITLCLSFPNSYGGMVAARAFLGVAEAGIMPAISYMLSTL
jgi:MFS family permease